MVDEIDDGGFVPVFERVIDSRDTLSAMLDIFLNTTRQHRGRAPQTFHDHPELCALIGHQVVL
jgi:hypothetical protein